jgi:hypothetical protein
MMAYIRNTRYIIWDRDPVFQGILTWIWMRDDCRMIVARSCKSRQWKSNPLWYYPIGKYMFFLRVITARMFWTSHLRRGLPQKNLLFVCNHVPVRFRVCIKSSWYPQEQTGFFYCKIYVTSLRLKNKYIFRLRFKNMELCRRLKVEGLNTLKRENPLHFASKWYKTKFAERWNFSFGGRLYRRCRWSESGESRRLKLVASVHYLYDLSFTIQCF